MNWHRHRWKARAVEWATLRPGGALWQERDITIILYGCACGDNTTRRFDGQWTLDQLAKPLQVGGS